MHTPPNSAGAIPAQHAQPEPSTSRLPSGASPLYGHRTEPQNSCLFSRLLEVLGLGFSAGASSARCLKKMKKSILTLVSLCSDKGIWSTTLQFPTASPRAILPFPIRSSNSRDHSSKTKAHFPTQINCAHRPLRWNPTVVFGSDNERSPWKMGLFQGRFFITIARNKEEEGRDKPHKQYKGNCQITRKCLSRACL